MALTLSAPKEDVWGKLRVRLVTVTFDNDLDEAGEALLPNDVGLSEIFWVSSSRAQGSGGAEVTAEVYWNANKLYAIISDSDFYGDNFDASTYSVTLLIVGI